MDEIISRSSSQEEPSTLCVKDDLLTQIFRIFFKDSMTPSATVFEMFDMVVHIRCTCQLGYLSRAISQERQAHTLGDSGDPRAHR